MQKTLTFKPNNARLFWSISLPIAFLFFIIYTIFIDMGFREFITWANQYDPISGLFLYIGAFIAPLYLTIFVAFPSILVFIEGFVLSIDEENGIVKTHKLSFSKDDISRIYVSEYPIRRLALELNDGKRRYVEALLLNYDIFQFQKDLEKTLSVEPFELQ